MEQEAMYFGENGIIENASNKNKEPININELYIKRIVLSYKRFYSKDLFKPFSGYVHKAYAFAAPLCIKVPQMNAYAKYFNENSKYMDLLGNDKKLLEKYNKIKLKVYLKRNLIVNQSIYI